MSDNPLEDLAKDIAKAGKDLEQFSSKGGWKRTVIVHPQLGRNAEEASQLSGDWRAREEKQLMENMMGAFGQ